MRIWFLSINRYTPNSGGQGELAERAIQWACLRYVDGQSGYDSTTTSKTIFTDHCESLILLPDAGWPNTYCESGFQARIHMPACWDGVVRLFCPLLFQN